MSRFSLFLGHVFAAGPAAAKQLPGSHLEQSEAMHRGPFQQLPIEKKPIPWDPCMLYLPTCC